MLSAVDDGVGEVMALLKKLGLSDNTFVMFTGDNGATREKRAGLNQEPAKAGSNHPFRGNNQRIRRWHARAGCDELAGRDPDGQLIHELGCHIDMLPTLGKAAGAALPSGHTIDGFDMLPLATAHGKSAHQAIFWSSSGQLAVRRANGS